MKKRYKIIENGKAVGHVDASEETYDSIVLEDGQTLEETELDFYVEQDVFMAEDVDVII